VTSTNGKLTAKINGVLVCEGEAEGASEGPLGWQSEGTPIEFKNIIVKEPK